MNKNAYFFNKTQNHRDQKIITCTTHTTGSPGCYENVDWSGLSWIESECFMLSTNACNLSLANTLFLKRCKEHGKAVTRGVTRGAKGAQFPGRQITMGALNHCGGGRKVPITCFKCICFRKTSGSNMGAPNLLLSLGTT